MGLLSSTTIKRVKVLGVTRAQETKVLATYNSAVYSILIEFENGSRSLLEVEAKQMQKYINYIDMD